VGEGAIPTERISGKVRQRFVVLSNLEEVSMPEPTTAPGAGSGLGATYQRSVDMLAGLSAIPEVLALAGLATTTERNLVDASVVVLRGDAPDTVLEADIGAVLFPKLAASLYSAGGFSPRTG